MQKINSRFPVNKLLLLASGIICALPINAAFAAAFSPTLIATAHAGACGGSVSCFLENQQTLSPATHLDSRGTSQSSTLIDGSYAHASAVASFGSEHVYADALRVDGSVYGDAQSYATAEFDDYIPANSTLIVSGIYQLTFSITGFHSPAAYGTTASSYLNYQIIDGTTNYGLDGGWWNSSDANPTTTLIKNVIVPTGHDIRLQVYFRADASMDNNRGGPSTGVLSDYSHTLNVYIDALTPGANTVGLSGHDYATPSVPLPGSLGLFISGLGLLGARYKQKRVNVS